MGLHIWLVKMYNQYLPELAARTALLRLAVCMSKYILNFFLIMSKEMFKLQADICVWLCAKASDTAESLSLCCWNKHLQSTISCDPAGSTNASSPLNFFRQYRYHPNCLQLFSIQSYMSLKTMFSSRQLWAEIRKFTEAWKHHLVTQEIVLCFYLIFFYIQVLLVESLMMIVCKKWK